MDETRWLSSLSSYHVVVASTLLSLIFIPIFISKRNKQRQGLPPAPPSLPVIGHLHLIKEPVHRTLEALSYRYGPVLSLSFGTRSVVVVSDPRAVEECFTKNDIILADRPRLNIGKEVSYGFTTLATANYGEHWRNLRRIATTEILSASQLDFSLGIRSEEVQLLVKGLYRVVSDRSIMRVEIRKRLQDLTFNITLRLISGKRIFGTLEEAADSREAETFKEVMEEILLLAGIADISDFLPAFRWLDLGRRDRRMRAHKKADSIFQGLVDEHKNKRGTQGDHRTMIDVMLSMQESDPKKYSDDIIKGQISTMLFAGVETSAVTIEWSMSLLLNHPEVMEKARAEIDHLIGLDRLVEESDINNLPYIQDIVKETLRLYPPAPNLLPHEASKDCTISGFHIPRGSMVIINAWKLHRDPELWVDPLAFRPERYNGIGDMAYKFIPFGMGRRSCPGAGMANRLVPFALAALIQCFEWERVGEAPVSLEEGTGVTLPKLHPLEVMCRARECMIDGVLAQLL